MVVFFALGCLLGWVISFIWPSYYRATTQVYVGLNPYRTHSDANFLALVKPKYQNIDNYHHWQMSQLEAAIYLDDFIQETLSELRQGDPYWEGINASQLRDLLDSNWRSAGKWSLIAEHKDSKYAQQAAQTWGKVIVKRVQDAILSARNTFMVDQELQAIAAEQLEASLRQQELSSTKDALLEWSESTQDLPTNQPLDSAERWSVLSLASRPAQFNPVWITVLKDQPHSDAPPAAYISWIGQITPIIDTELSALDQRIVTLEQQHNKLTKEYSSEADYSLGLSPNLAIEGIDHLPVKVIRSPSTFAVIGGAIGLLIWALTQLIIISNREQSQ